MSQSCVFCLGSISSRVRRRENSLIKSSHVIERYGLTNKGDVGSLYDACIDEVSSKSLLDKNFIIEQKVEEAANCQLIGPEALEHGDLLHIIGIEGDLWISIVLGMTSVYEGTSTIYNYQLPANRSVRFLYYYRVDHQISLFNDNQVARDALVRSLNNNKATHIITSVKQGIDFVIALEFPNNENTHDIDSDLKKICKYFRECESEFLSSEEEARINQLTPTIFTQIAEIHTFANKHKKFGEICQYIHQYIFDHEHHFPLSYTLNPIKCLDANGSLNGGTFVPLDSLNITKIENIILGLFNKLKTIEHLCGEIHSFQLPHHLRPRYDKAFEKLNQVKNIYGDIKISLADNVFKLRRQTMDLSSFDNELRNLEYKTLDTELETLTEELVKLKNKASFIAELKKKYGLEYYNVADIKDEDDDEQILLVKIVSLHHQELKRFLCSSDKLFKQDRTQHEKLCQQLLDDQKKNPSMELFFADFSYCSLSLSKMTLLPKVVKPSIPSSTGASSVESNELNILLLGETGVGKSTFINAFVNYLSFQTFETAEKGEPIVLIPVSFLMTSNDQLDEFEVKLGDFNSNENFDQPGRTITQHCESYIFNLDNNTKLRIIDTPGIGDTRGLTQDDENIQQILSYVNNLSYLNAVCILLKPNTSRLHVLFRSCLEQIFNFLGPNARDNIVFCFTSSRSTFYLPGNTAPLLKKMLKDISDDHVPSLTKENMFCFDSESFRYLAAIKTKKDIQFNEDQKAEFRTSWNKSVSESVRLINLIKSCPMYQMNKWHSTKHAQIMVTTLIRPILETIRNTLRNVILWESKDKQRSIGLLAQPVSQLTYLCAACPYEVIKINHFPIISHSAHQYRKPDECNTCHCDHNQHISTLYKLQYKLNNNEIVQFNSKTQDMQDCLLEGSINLTHFLLHAARISENPFLFWLDLFIREELYLCSHESNILNSELHMRLNELKDEYQKKLHEIQHDQEHINIDKIYQWIEKIQEFPVINDQMNIIRQSQMALMKNHTHDVSLQYPNLDMRALLN